MMKRYLRVDEVARMLGKSKRSIYRYIERGDLQAVKRFGCMWVIVDELSGFVEGEKSVTNSDKIEKSICYAVRGKR